MSNERDFAGDCVHSDVRVSFDQSLTSLAAVRLASAHRRAFKRQYVT